ncbi:MAG: deoxynucleoside kinase [Acidobacteriota bacterium]
MKPDHIAVEGPIGVGKTTLTRRLANHYGCREVLEDLRNPFLEDFYAGTKGAAFQCQVYFLLQRYSQQQQLLQGDLFRQRTVCDYLFHKDKIFAYLNLDQDDLNVYERLYGVLVEQLPKPDLVIYLQAPDEVLLERIARRDRRAERRISRDYLSELNKAYNYFFFHYSETPLLAINTSQLDLAKSKEDFDVVLRQVEQLEGGTRYFVPE